MGRLMRLAEVVALLVALWNSPLRASGTGLVYDPAEVGSEEGMVALFERWRVKHGRVYREEGERQRRYVAFKESVKYVERWRKENEEKKGRGSSHRVGLNRFADLTNQEFKKIYSRKMHPLSKRRPRGGEKEGSDEWRSRRELMASCVAPATLDWRKKGVVTAVKDQGDCGIKISVCVFYAFALPSFLTAKPGLDRLLRVSDWRYLNLKDLPSLPLVRRR